MTAAFFGLAGLAAIVAGLEIFAGAPLFLIINTGFGVAAIAGLGWSSRKA